MNNSIVKFSAALTFGLVLTITGCTGSTQAAKGSAAASIDECPGKPIWACIAEAAPCPLPEFQGKICAVGIANNMSESLGSPTASTAAKAALAKYFEARVVAFNKRFQGLHGAGDTSDEVQKVQDSVEQYAKQTMVGVMTPKRFYEPSTRSTYVLAMMDEVSFKKWADQQKAMRTLSKETIKKIDAMAAETDAEIDKIEAKKDAEEAKRSSR